MIFDWQILISYAMQGFATGLGVGIVNWLFVKRLEKIEEKIKIDVEDLKNKVAKAIKPNEVNNGSKDSKRKVLGDKQIQ